MILEKETAMSFEEMVKIDMAYNGYNPEDPLDIAAYWEIRLS